jgi:hypothetical protein
MLSFETFVETPPDKNERQSARELSKAMSQVVAKSWLPEGNDIRLALLSNDPEKIKKTFEDNGCDFSHYEGYKIELDVNSFEGNLKDLKETIVVAYPPRPSDFNLSDEDLRNWVNNTDPNQTRSGHLYIPVTY